MDAEKIAKATPGSEEPAGRGVTAPGPPAASMDPCPKRNEKNDIYHGANSEHEAKFRRFLTDELCVSLVLASA